MSQRIVIPKGLINPHETTIIEIPEAVKGLEMVIAKPIFPRTCPREFGDQPFNPDASGDETANIDYLQNPRLRQKYSLHKPTSPTIDKNLDSAICKQKVIAAQNETSCNSMGKDTKSSNVPIVPMLRKKIPSEDASAVLDVMEKMEFRKLYKNLRQYQSARRKLLYETSNLDTFEEISQSLRAMR